MAFPILAFEVALKGKVNVDEHTDCIRYYICIPNDKLEKKKQTCVLLPELMETHNDWHTIRGCN